MFGSRGRWLAIALSVGLLGLTSCSSNAPVALPNTGASLEGAVKYGDKILAFGIVIVEGAGSSAQGQINQDGTYRVENVPVGAAKLAVVTNPGMARGAQMAGGRNVGPGDKGKGALGKVPDYVDVPTKYHSTATSGLAYTIQQGVNQHDIVIGK